MLDKSSKRVNKAIQVVSLSTLTLFTAESAFSRSNFSFTDCKGAKPGIGGTSHTSFRLGENPQTAKHLQQAYESYLGRGQVDRSFKISKGDLTGLGFAALKVESQSALVNQESRSSLVLFFESVKEYFIMAKGVYKEFIAILLVGYLVGYVALKAFALFLTSSWPSSGTTPPVYPPAPPPPRNRPRSGGDDQRGSVQRYPNGSGRW